jgi:hypothetical protein
MVLLLSLEWLGFLLPLQFLLYCWPGRICFYFGLLSAIYLFCLSTSICITLFSFRYTGHIYCTVGQVEFVFILVCYLLSIYLVYPHQSVSYCFLLGTSLGILIILMEPFSM